MTHSLHRRGNLDTLKNDFVLLARGDLKGQPEKAKKLVRIISNNKPVGVITKRKGIPIRHMSNWREGKTLDELVEISDQPRYVAGIYITKEDLEAVIGELSEADLGFSITVSGVFDEVFDCCKKIGIEPHTVNMSMETLGRTELLPEDKILEITTMCGHSLIGQNLVRHVINRVRKGKMTAEEASIELGSLCVCNFFNHKRAEKVIEEYVTRQR